MLSLHLSRPAICASLLLVLTGCPAPGGEPTTGSSGSTSETGPQDSVSSAGTPATVPTTGDDPSAASVPTSGTTTDSPDTAETGATDGTDSSALPCEGPACDAPVVSCAEDIDHDGVALQCDNAPDHTNPDQLDMDKDGFGDVFDLCPTVPGDNNKFDTDQDGVGDGCDLCARKPAFYNKDVADVPAHMRVRNIPLHGDADRDGIGDACDNCVWVPNCAGFGAGDGLVPYEVGTEIDVEAAGCQDDADLDLVGDACAGAMRPGAAGPVGLGHSDDFDQDGLINLADKCPRQPVTPQACADDSECPAMAVCSDGVCNHIDHDNDGLGDVCDTCVHHANPKQATDGGAQEDDPDSDFIGAVCEGSVPCIERPNPRPFAFFDISVGGLCCVAAGAGAPLVDPLGGPVDPGGLNLPPGMLTLPPGCEEAIAASPNGQANQLTTCDPAAQPALWDHMCLLPAHDQDIDTVPDMCDLCPFAFDPDNQIFVDEMNMEFPEHGKFCNGAFDEELLDPAKMCLP